ncbi:MAG TPA: alpha/beta fold hydrolase, partial [Acidimicrobiales bacterium]|nr:alpha/beta fold hydrolase [Acidimicrobiales bacterium]
MPTIDRDGVAIAYEVTGDGPGVPLLCTHGFSADRHSWAAVVEHCAAGRRCVTWDVRGHGCSDAPADADRYTPELTLDDMAALLDAVGAPRAVVVGHSMGGYLSLRFAAARPERVAGLVLVDTGPGYRNPEARARWNDMCATFAARIDERGADGLGRSTQVRAATHP